MKLTVEKVLIYYDVPQLFSAKDAVGSNYLCLLVDDSNDKLQYLTLPVSRQKLTEVVTGIIDLRTAFVISEIDKWFIVSEFFENTAIASEADFKIVPEEFLPDEGCYCEVYDTSEEVIISEVLERDNTIIHFAMEDGMRKHSISANHLSNFVRAFQDLLKHVYKRVMRTAKTIKDWDKEENYELRAFGASSSSLNVHFENEGKKDMYKNALIEHGLSKIDEILQYDGHHDTYISYLKQIKGHSIGALKKLINNIIAENVNIKYKWLSPSSNKFSKVNKIILNVDKALEIKKILDSVSEDLSEEDRVFKGFVKKVDLKGTWRIFNESDEKEYSGEALNTSLLSGITTDTKKYKFICLETISADKITDKETIKYILKEVIEEEEEGNSYSFD